VQAVADLEGAEPAPPPGSPDPLDGLSGPTSKWRGDREREKGGKERVREREGRPLSQIPGIAPDKHITTADK